MSRGRRWTKEEIRFLKRHLGREPVDWIAKRLRRTPNAIWCKANDIGISPSDFSHALVDIIRDTGYNWKQILKAKKELKQKWKRRKKKKGSRYYITEDQKQELLRHLAKPGPKYPSQGPTKSDIWSPSLHIHRCLHCGTNEKPHHSLGLCETCFRKLLAKKTEHKHHKLLVRYWQIAVELDLPQNPHHPLDQLDKWDTCTLLDISVLNIRVRKTA